MHFLCLVLAPHGTLDVEGYVGRVLRPYGDDGPSRGYDAPCFCVGERATVDSKKKADEKFGTIAELQQKVQASPRFSKLSARQKEITDRLVKSETTVLIAEEGKVRDELAKVRGQMFAIYEKTTKPYSDYQARILKSHPLREAPTPDCQFCKGKGFTKEYGNPRNYWDWFELGGRWTGVLDPSYDPSKDPENLDTCWVCKGEKKSKDGGRCPQCSGFGKAMKFKLRRFEGDVKPADKIHKNLVPYALIAPDGEWHQAERRLWPDEDTSWSKRARALIRKHAKKCVAIVVDCHS